MNAATREFRKRHEGEKANSAIHQSRKTVLDVGVNMCYTLLMASRVLLSE